MRKIFAFFVTLLVMVSVLGFNAKSAYAATKVDTINIKITRKGNDFPAIKVSGTGLTFGSPLWSCTKAQLSKTMEGQKVTVSYPVTVKSGYYISMPIKYNVSGDGAKNYSVSLKIANGKGTLSITVPVYRQLAKPQIVWLSSTYPTWGKVSGASSYTIILYDATTGKKVLTKTTTKTFLRIEDYVGPGEYRMKLRANSGNTYVLPSEYVEAYITIYKVYAIPKG